MYLSQSMVRMIRYQIIIRVNVDVTSIKWFSRTFYDRIVIQRMIDTILGADFFNKITSSI